MLVLSHATVISREGHYFSACSFERNEIYEDLGEDFPGRFECTLFALPPFISS